MESYIPFIVNKSGLNIRGFTDAIPCGKNYFRTDFPSDDCCGLSDLIEVSKSVPKSQIERTLSRKNFHKKERHRTEHHSKEESTNFHYIENQENIPVLCIGVALYNEPPEELRRVLVSLADQVKEMKDTCHCQVILVSDGHAQMHKKTQIYLKTLFCSNLTEEKNFDILIESLDNYCIEKALADEDERIETALENRKVAPPPLTYVLQKTKNGLRLPIRIRGGKDGNNDRYLNLTLVMKSLNRRKCNSQLFMLNFASNCYISSQNSQKSQNSQDLKSADYIFLTDCGTLYEKGCLLRLVSYIHNNPKCVGCTGRQRVMTSEEQDCEEESFIEKYFRLVQLADYEGSYATYTGAFSLAGCLPVLPGPCCMLRLSALNVERVFQKEDPLDELISGRRKFYESDEVINSNERLLESNASNSNNSNSNSESVESYDIENTWTSMELAEIVEIKRKKETGLEHFKTLVETGPGETNLVIENVKLAEDRIPSYAAVTHGEKGAYTTWVDGAIFKFQAERLLKVLLNRGEDGLTELFLVTFGLY